MFLGQIIHSVLGCQTPAALIFVIIRTIKFFPWIKILKLLKRLKWPLKQDLRPMTGIVMDFMC